MRLFAVAMLILVLDGCGDENIAFPGKAPAAAPTSAPTPGLE
jgi:hypothetical protein